MLTRMTVHEITQSVNINKCITNVKKSTLLVVCRERGLQRTLSNALNNGVLFLSVSRRKANIGSGLSTTATMK